MAIRAVGAHKTNSPTHVDTAATLPAGYQCMFVWDDTVLKTQSDLIKVIKDLMDQAQRSTYFPNK